MFSKLLPLKVTAIAATTFLVALSSYQPSALAGGRSDKLCVFNYYHQKPCISTPRVWRQFADKHGLEYDRTSAAIFQAYTEWDFEQGNRLLAQAKGVDVSELKGIGRQIAEATRSVYR